MIMPMAVFISHDDTVNDDHCDAGEGDDDDDDGDDDGDHWQCLLVMLLLCASLCISSLVLVLDARTM